MFYISSCVLYINYSNVIKSTCKYTRACFQNKKVYAKEGTFERKEASFLRCEQYLLYYNSYNASLRDKNVNVY
jgi:hypothetical protein